MADATSTKRRKNLPSCNYCRSKRVICHPQQNGSCPRCLEKGILCTTPAPAARRRRRTKTEMQEERAKKTVKSAVEGQEAHMNDTEVALDIWSLMQLSVSSQTDYGTPHPIPPGIDLSVELVSELFQIFRILPQSHHPIIPLDDLESSLRLLSWNLTSLPSPLRLLAKIIITVASFFSTNAAIVGPGGCGPEIACTVLSKAPLKELEVPDLREYGVRRKSVCCKLWAEALWLAQQQGITAHVSRENAASCWLIDFLECQFSGQGVSTYASAYNGHLRCLAETTIDTLPGCTPEVSETSVLYSAYMMHDAVYAITSRRSIPFSHNDELLIVGPCTTSLELLLQLFLSGASTRKG
ncbi:hypothetical protein J3R30DRAFT_1132193 [Lentinula aciculospora]|uniref:Zn(2)-C6 fungal-type domain-containing protein n=1 Tax=Lentinula aciculospora TaxID=153920 RepID=A0A9W8ZZG5_9AGAR|nr:hypothetical protein J3R30DRAFT_1132193 [Lentinula aciculospora]